MKVRLAAGGISRAVEVRPDDAGYVVTLDGHEHAVNVSDSGGVWSLLTGTRSHEVAFVDQPDGSTMVLVDGRAVRVVVESPERSWGRRGRGSPAAATGDGGPQRVKAPMPGRVVKLLVKPGDVVQPRQGLVVVEAMKMENELRSERPGTVSKVCVAEGASVEAGVVLVIVE